MHICVHVQEGWHFSNSFSAMTGDQELDEMLAKDVQGLMVEALEESIQQQRQQQEQQEQQQEQQGSGSHPSADLAASTSDGVGVNSEGSSISASISAGVGVQGSENSAVNEIVSKARPGLSTLHLEVLRLRLGLGGMRTPVPEEQLREMQAQGLRELMRKKGKGGSDCTTTMHSSSTTNTNSTDSIVASTNTFNSTDSIASSSSSSSSTDTHINATASSSPSTSTSSNSSTSSKGRGKKKTGRKRVPKEELLSEEAVQAKWSTARQMLEKLVQSGKPAPTTK